MKGSIRQREEDVMETYLELYDQAERDLEYSEITIGEFEKRIEPLKQEAYSWIPVTKGEPDLYADCLVTVLSPYGRHIVQAVYDGDGKWSREDWRMIILTDKHKDKCYKIVSTKDDNIIAWRYSPKPYKETLDNVWR